LALSLGFNRGKTLPGKGALSCSMDGVRDQNLPGAGMFHQPRGQVYFVSQDPVGAARRPAVSASTHRPATDSDLDGGNEAKISLSTNNFPGDSQRSPDVILMGNRCSKTGVEVTALVPNRYVDDKTLVTCKQVLEPANESAEVLPGFFISIIINSLEFYE